MQVKKLKSAKDKDIALQNSLDIEDKVSCRLVEVLLPRVKSCAFHMYVKLHRGVCYQESSGNNLFVIINKGKVAYI